MNTKRQKKITKRKFKVGDLVKITMSKTRQVKPRGDTFGHDWVCDNKHLVIGYIGIDITEVNKCSNKCPFLKDDVGETLTQFNEDFAPYNKYELKEVIKLWLK